MQTDGRTERRTEMVKQTVAFHNFVNAHKKLAHTTVWFRRNTMLPEDEVPFVELTYVDKNVVWTVRLCTCYKLHLTV